MNWDGVWSEGVKPAIAAESDITDILGTAFFLAGTRQFRVPSMTARMFFDTEGENWAPAEWQFDIYARTLEQVKTIARAMRRRFHHPVQQELGPFLLWTEFVDGRGLEGPDNDQYFAYSMDFRFTPGRSIYLTDQES